MKADSLALLRARCHALAVAEADEASTLDPNDPERWGVDPDDIYDRSREDRL